MYWTHFDVLQWWTWTQCVCRHPCSSSRPQCCSVSWLRRASAVLRCGSECSISRYASDHPTSHTPLRFMYKVSLADNFIQMNFCFVNKLILCTIMSFCIFLLLIQYNPSWPASGFLIASWKSKKQFVSHGLQMTMHHLHTSAGALTYYI